MQSRNLKKVIIAGLLLVIFIFLYTSYWYMVKCEGEWQGIPFESKSVFNLAEIRKGLESSVDYMAGVLGPRNYVHYAQLQRCKEWIRQRWKSEGYTVNEQTFFIEGKEYTNLEIEFPGRTAPSEIIIVSAQYDTLPDSPGANNNSSGTAILLQLSRLLRNYTPDRTLRLVAFTTEEDPFFGTEMMGSYLYAKRSGQIGENILVTLSLDALGIYKEEPNSQRLPFPFSLFYPNRGNFLAFIGNLHSRKYLKESTMGFKKGSSFPVKAGAVPEWAKGAGWSDHSSFWKFGYPAIMITDTGGFRSPYHTTKDDTMEKLNFDAMSRIVVGMYSAIVELTKKQ